MRLGKIITVITGVMTMMFLYGCTQKKQESSVSITETITITVENQMEEADVWILSDTEENRKTTVWGTALIAGLPAEGKKSVDVPVSEENLYLLRMIDTDQMFYSADAIVLGMNYSIVIVGGTVPMSATAQVFDENGTLVQEYPVFMAKL